MPGQGIGTSRRRKQLKPLTLNTPLRSETLLRSNPAPLTPSTCVVGDWDPQEEQAKWWSNFVADFSVSLSLYFSFEVHTHTLSLSLSLTHTHTHTHFSVSLSLYFYFEVRHLFTLVTGPRRSLRLKLSDTRVDEP